ncbi:translation initiation factor eIF 4e-like domain-containing protein, partial [Chytriomyces sp. MP71]
MVDNHPEDQVPPQEVHALTASVLPVDITLKHKLNRQWTLWFDSQQKRANQHNWHDSLKNLITFESVEDFWGVYNNVIKASALSAGSNFHLFQAGIQPMWEDPQNEKGGKWVAQVTKPRAPELDNLWLNTMLSVIGESFADASEILGAVVSVRRHGNRLSLWT